jgi:hypothetical protein
MWYLEKNILRIFSPKYSFLFASQGVALRAQANSIIMSFLFDEILLTVILTVSKDNPD